LLPDYPLKKNSGGVPYHRNFAKMELDSNFADKISFVELLNIPTIGNTGTNKNQFFKMLDLRHLKQLEHIFLKTGKKTVFVSPSILNDLEQISLDYGIFSWMFPIIQVGKVEELSVVYKNSDLIMIKTYHFSYGGIHRQLDSMKRIVESRV
jgi:hypothetical protein